MQSDTALQVNHSAAKVKKPFTTRFRETVKSYIKNKYLILLLLPTIIFFAVFSYGPMYGILIAFKDYKFAKGIMGSPWVGLEHFRTMFSGSSFTTVFKNTLIISSLKFVFGFPAPIILALLLNELRSQKLKRVVQTVSYLPHFLSWVILAGIFMQLLSPSLGPIGYVMKLMGLKPIYFLGDTRWFRTVLVVSSLWKEVGWGTIVYLSGIANVNPELYEAATVDGANRVHKAWNVTLPALVPIITFIFIISIGSIINDDFDQLLNLTNPAVDQIADVISTYTYKMGLVRMEYSYSTAVGLFKNVISVTLVLITNFLLKKISDNEYRII